MHQNNAGINQNKLTYRNPANHDDNIMGKGEDGVYKQFNGDNDNDKYKDDEL